ncbi:nnrS family protein [Photobacterium leiognathi subsp. mandapamensis]|nr:nnrS family protein [Photobacterium leiognathi subsp. mandapamensis]PSV21957.1 NnrS family protein [Photobacterium leiognathi subsp. mandapamensis]
MQIVDKTKEDKIPAILRLGFRPFFLGASTFSVFAMLIWALFWSGQSQLAGVMYANPIWWHSHEMLFGFSGAIIIGFLLTAVQNWTGQTGIKGTRLLLVFSLWLIARLGLMFAPLSIVWLVIDTAWIFLAMYYLAIPIVKVKQWRNLFFIPVLALFGMMNVKFHLVALGMLSTAISTLTLPIVLVVSLITLVVGGRVIPFFTWRGTQTEQITRVKVIEYAALIPIWLLLFATLIPSNLIPANWIGVLAIITALTNFVRFSRWRTLSTLSNPLLWTLHLAYLSLIIGLFALGVSYVSNYISVSIAIHIMAIGGIGGMILSMISRVSLGHTGRKLKVNMLMPISFIALFASLLARVVLILVLPSITIDGYVLSACLWALAFAIFAIVYYPILTQPRVDGHPG